MPKFKNPKSPYSQHDRPRLRSSCPRRHEQDQLFITSNNDDDDDSHNVNNNSTKIECLHRCSTRTIPRPALMVLVAAAAAVLNLVVNVDKSQQAIITSPLSHMMMGFGSGPAASSINGFGSMNSASADSIVPFQTSFLSSSDIPTMHRRQGALTSFQLASSLLSASLQSHQEAVPILNTNSATGSVPSMDSLQPSMGANNQEGAEGGQQQAGSSGSHLDQVSANEQQHSTDDLLAISSTQLASNSSLDTSASTNTAQNTTTTITPSVAMVDNFVSSTSNTAQPTTTTTIPSAAQNNTSAISEVSEKQTTATSSTNQMMTNSSEPRKTDNQEQSARQQQPLTTTTTTSSTAPTTTAAATTSSSNDRKPTTENVLTVNVTSQPLEQSTSAINKNDESFEGKTTTKNVGPTSTPTTSSSTTTAATTTTTTTSEPSTSMTIGDLRRAQSGSMERQSRMSDYSNDTKINFTDKFASTRTRPSFGSPGTNSNEFIVATVPVLGGVLVNGTASGNGSQQQPPGRLVNEFVFLPADQVVNAPPLGFDESAYPINRHQTNNQSSESLPAEHRTLDGDSSSGGVGELELDYMNMEVSPIGEGQDEPLEPSITRSGSVGGNSNSSSPLPTTPSAVVGQSQTSSYSQSMSSSLVSHVDLYDRLRSIASRQQPSSTAAPAQQQQQSSANVQVIAAGTPRSTTTTTTGTSQTTTTTTTAKSTTTSTAKPSGPSGQQSFDRVSTNGLATINFVVGQPALFQATRTSSTPSPPTNSSRQQQQSSSVGTTPSSVRKNNKYLGELPQSSSNEPLAQTRGSSAIPQPLNAASLPSSTTTTTSTTRRPTQPSGSQAPAISSTTARPSRFVASTRRPKSIAGHRAYFNEPAAGDWQRRRKPLGKNGTNVQHYGGESAYSPILNGADEEEANILTRYSIIPSQLSRLSSNPGQTSSRAATSSTEKPHVRLNAVAQRSVSSPLATTTTRKPSEQAMRQATTTTSEAPSPVISTDTQTTIRSTVIRVAENSDQKPETIAKRLIVESGLAEAKTRSQDDLASRLVEGETGELMMTLIASSLNANNGSALVQEDLQAAQAERSKQATPTSTTTTTSTQPPTTGSEAVQQVSKLTVDNTLENTRRLEQLQRQQQQQQQSDEEAQLFSSATAAAAAEAAQMLRDETQVTRRGAPSRAPAGSTTSNSYMTAPRQQQSQQKITSATSIKKVNRAQQKPVKVRNSQETYAEPSREFDSGQWRPDTHVDYSAPGASYQDSASVSRPGIGTGPHREAGSTAEAAAAAVAVASSSLPGRPGIDYPVHWQVPKTSFDCRNYDQSGFYADVESDCQAYHSCHRGRGGRHTFLCPNGTLFSQELLTCDWWYNVECSASKLYMPNAEAGSDSPSPDAATMTTSS